MRREGGNEEEGRKIKSSSRSFRFIFDVLIRTIDN